MELQEKLMEFQQSVQGLSQKEQQEKLQEFLKTLDKEEIEQLQQGQCVICGIAQGAVPSNVVYEDPQVKAVLDINPVSKGHAILFSKEHVGLLVMLPDELVGKLFIVANSIAKAQFESLKAEGTNILVSNGAGAGQTLPHAIINIIPRYKGDKIKFELPPSKADSEELKNIAEEIRSKVVVEKEEDVVEEKEIEEEEFYREHTP